MEERTSVIEVGDTLLSTDDDYRVVVTKVQQGSHGLLVTGRFPDYGDQFFEGFFPPEFAPVKGRDAWQGWPSRSSATLLNGVRFGTLGLLNGDKREGDLRAYEAKWKRTMKAEEGVMQSRPTEIRLN